MLGMEMEPNNEDSDYSGEGEERKGEINIRRSKKQYLKVFENKEV